VFYISRKQPNSPPAETTEPTTQAAGETPPAQKETQPTAERPEEPAAPKAEKQTPDARDDSTGDAPKAAAEHTGTHTSQAAARDTSSATPGTKDAANPREPAEKPAETKETAPKEAVKKPAEKPESDAPPFDKAAAVAALNSAVGQASGCRQPGDPSGTARVVITFAPSGRVTSANLSGPPFAGTRTGGCIASTMRRARVPAFSGSHVTVSKSVVIR
jgi:hypothetical protein